MPDTGLGLIFSCVFILPKSHSFVSADKLEPFHNHQNLIWIFWIHDPIVTPQPLMGCFVFVVAGSSRIEPAQIRAHDLNRFLYALKIRAARSPTERIISARLFSAG